MVGVDIIDINVSYDSFNEVWETLSQEDCIVKWGLPASAKFISDVMNCPSDEVLLRQCDGDDEVKYIIIGLDQGSAVFRFSNGETTFYVCSPFAEHEGDLLERPITDEEFNKLFEHYYNLEFLPTKEEISMQPANESIVKETDKEEKPRLTEADREYLKIFKEATEKDSARYEKDSKVIRTCAVITTCICVAVGGLVFWDRFRP